MPNTTISDLSAASSVNDSDVTVIDQSGSTLKITRALLVGSANNTISSNSAAFGYTNTASGDYSVAVGINNTASGDYSVAMGNSCEATYTHAVAIGVGCVASDEHAMSVGGTGFSGNLADGEYASALGYDNQVTQDQATSVGNFNQSTGFGSTVIGANNTASGTYAVAAGYDNRATNNGSCAVGAYNNATGSQSTAVGYGNTSNSEKSSTFGMNNNADAEEATAIGYNNNATGGQSTAIGFNNTASGYYPGSTAIGYNNTTNGQYANGSGLEIFGRNSAFGYYNVASGFYYSQTFGANNIIRGSHANYCSAVGYGNSIIEDEVQHGSAFGAGNNVTGNSANAFGYSNTASGAAGNAFGIENTASQESTSAFGAYNTASGQGASAFGNENQVSGERSSAFGAYNAVSGSKSIAAGYGNTTHSNYSSVFGWNNLTLSATYNTVAVGNSNISAAFGATAVGQQSLAISPFSVGVGNQNLSGYMTWFAPFTISSIIDDTITLIDPDEYFSQMLGIYDGLAVVQVIDNPNNNGVYFAYQVDSREGTTILTVEGLTSTEGDGGIQLGLPFFTLSNDFSALTIVDFSTNTITVGGDATWILQYTAVEIPIFVQANTGNIFITQVSGVSYDGTNTTIDLGSNPVYDRSGNPSGTLIVYSPVYWANTQQGDPTSINITTVDQDAKTFTVGGDHSSYATMGYLLVAGSTGNDGVYTLVSLTYDDPNTTFTVSQSIPDGTADGTLQAGQNVNLLPWEAVAIGYSNQSTGLGAFSAGLYNTTSGYYGVSLGYQNTASGYGSTAVGAENTVSGEYSYAFGFRNTISDAEAVAIGMLCTAAAYSFAAGVTSNATGDHSLAIGFNNTSSQSETVAVGYNNSATGIAAAAVGIENSASGEGSTACGYSNTANAYQCCAFGAYNQATGEAKNMAFGWGNIVAGNTGAAFGISNSIYNNSSVALGIANQSNSFKSTAVGYRNIVTDSNYGSAVGYSNTSSSLKSSAFGCNNTASGYYASAFGYLNTADNRASAFGIENSASGEYSVAIGYSNTASNNYSVAIGYSNTSSGIYATAIGTNAIARIQGTTNIGGPIIVRKDNDESSTSFFQFLSLSGVETTLTSIVVDLTSTSNVNIDIPTGSSFFPNECGLIITHAVNVTAQPTIEFGDEEANNDLVPAVQTTGLTSFNNRQRFVSLANGDGHTSLNAHVTIGATADNFTGRFYWKGLLVEDTVVETPSFNFSGGSYTSPISITLTSTVPPDVTIYYTTDGSSPTPGSTIYSDGIAMYTTQTITALAVSVRGQWSEISGGQTYNLTVATPEFNWPTSAYDHTLDVTITCSTGPATIYYTTDGSDPTTGSTQYTTPVPVTVTTTLKAFAVLAGANDSPIQSATYTLICEPASFSVTTGTYSVAQSLTLSSNQPIYYTTDGSTPDAFSTLYTGAIDINVSETIKTKAIQTGWVSSGVGSNTYTLVCDDPGFVPSGSDHANVFTVVLVSPSSTPVYYTTDGSTPDDTSTLYTGTISVTTSPTVIKAISIQSGWTSSNVISNTYTLTCANPVASPVAGTYYGTQSVTLTSTTSGVSIYYTTDGSNPTTGSTLYTGAISVAVSQAVKAFAHEANFNDSSIVEFDYTISSVAAPTVNTDSLTNHNDGSAQLYGTVVSENGESLTAYGFVWNTTGSPTLSDNVVTVGTSTFTGDYNTDITGLPYATVYFAAYATNGVGTTYGSTVSAYVGPCLVKGTKITLADGTKKNIEDVTYGDSLLVWNFDDGVFDSAKPVWMASPWDAPEYALVKFSDGSELGTPNDGKGHRIFNVNESTFTHLTNGDTPLGATTFNENREVLRVVSSETVNEPTTFYNIITDKHINVFANSILTSTGLNNFYPVVNMKFVKSGGIVRWSREEFASVPDAIFEGFRLAEQPSNYPGLKEKIAGLVRKQQ